MPRHWPRRCCSKALISMSIDVSTVGSIAKFCDLGNQHFAQPGAETGSMASKTVNFVFAEALRYYMGTRWTAYSLSRRSGVAESTIRNYLSPDTRKQGASGKEPSAKLTEVSMLAKALGVAVADLVTDATDEERLRGLRERAGQYYAEHGELPDWAPRSDKPQDAAA